LEFPSFDSNTKLAAVYYNGGTPPHLFRIHNDVTLSGLKDELDQINRQLSHRDTRRVVGVDYDVHCLTQPDLFVSAGWNSQTMTTWEPCSLSMLSTVLEDRSSWTLCWLDLLNKFWKVCTGPGTMKRSGLCWRDQRRKKLV